jgi:hypothetical protein
VIFIVDASSAESNSVSPAKPGIRASDPNFGTPHDSADRSTNTTAPQREPPFLKPLSHDRLGGLIHEYSYAA